MIRRTLALGLIVSTFVGCTRHQVTFNFSDYKIFTSDQPGNKGFEDVGPVSGSTYSWIWTSCNEATISAVKEMLDEAKALGANAVYKVRFMRKGTPSLVAICEKQWGWLMAMIPIATVVDVVGVAAKVENSSQVSHLVPLKQETDTELLARSIVAEAISE